MYWDANILYGWAMSQKLPIDNFKQKFPSNYDEKFKKKYDKNRIN